MDDEHEIIEGYEPTPSEPVGGWSIRREGRSWSPEEWALRREIGPDKFELIRGRLFWCEEDRLAVLGMLLENVGADRAVMLGDPAVWRAAIAKLDHSS